MSTIAAFVFLAYLAGLRDVVAHLQSLSLGSLLFSVILQTAVIVALSWRWWAVVRSIGVNLPCLEALRLTFTATFFNMVLPTSVGGDVSRVWFARRHGLSVRDGAVAAVFDRLVGLAALVIVVACAIPFVPSALPNELQLALAVLPLGAIAAACVLHYAHRLAPNSYLGRAALGLRSLLRRRSLFAATFIVSVLGHVAASGIAALIAQDMGLDLPFATAILLFPAVLLATLVPVSIGGWGIRELAAVPLLGLAGVEPAGATAIALTFGLTQLSAASLGTIVLWLIAERTR